MTTRGMLPSFLLLLLLSAPTQLGPARQAAAKGDWTKAEEAARLYLRDHPDSEEATVLHARALFGLSHPFDAALELEDFLKRKPASVAARKLYAALLVDVVDDRPMAEQVLLEASKLAPRDAGVWEGLGKLYLGRHRTTEAIRCFRQAVRLAPANALFAAGLARTLEEDGKPEEAEAQYRQALRLSKAKPEPWVDIFYAGFLSKQGRHADSLGHYTKALLADPHSAEAYQGRALAQENLGDLKNAEADALAALREAPGRRDARQSLIRIYRASGDEAKMREQAEALEKVVAAQQRHLAQGREMRAALGEAERLLAAGKFAEAIPPYERVIAASPDFYEAYFAVGVAYQQTGQAEKAERALRRYLEYQPLSADGHAALGLTYAAAGREADAKAELEAALKLNPELAEPRKVLGQMELKRVTSAGDRRKALEACETELRAHPGEAALEELHASLLLGCSRMVACKTKAIEALKRNPQSPAYLKAVTEMLIDRSAIDPVTADMVERARKSLPADPGAAFLYAKWAYASNDLDLALAESKKLAENAQAAPLVRAKAFTLAGLTEERLGHLAEAEAAYRHALELNRTLPSPDPQMALHYADFLTKQSREAEADTLVGEMLKWSPDFATGRLRRAVYLDNQGKSEEAVREAEAVVLRADEDPLVLRAAHSLLARTYSAMGRPELAKSHQDWIVANSK